MAKKQGITIPKTPTRFEPTDVRWRLPGDLLCALEIAAKKNEVSVLEVVKFVLTRSLKAELVTVRAGVDSGEKKPAPTKA